MRASCAQRGVALGDRAGEHVGSQSDCSFVHIEIRGVMSPAARSARADQDERCWDSLSNVREVVADREDARVGL